MSFDPITLGIIGGTLGAASSAFGTMEQNDALSQQASNATTAAGLNAEQLVEARKLDRLKKLNDREQLVGRTRVAAAENGTGMGGSQAALERQALIDESINNQIADKNFNAQMRALKIGLQSQLVTLNSQMANPLLSGIAGGLAGATTGLTIGNTVNAANAIPAQKVAMPDRTTSVTRTLGTPTPENYL